LDHSPGQLRLLTEAAVRIEAGAAMLDLHTTFAAVAASMAKENGKIMEKMQKELAKRAGGKSDV